RTGLGTISTRRIARLNDCRVRRYMGVTNAFGREALGIRGSAFGNQDDRALQLASTAVMAAGALVGSLPANPRTLVVIPTYNERESIGALLREVRKVAAVDVLVVDDGSPDGTADAVAAVRA